MFIGNRKCKLRDNKVLLIKDEVFNNYVSIIDYDLKIIKIMGLKEFIKFKDACVTEGNLKLLESVRIGRKNSNGEIALTKEELQALGISKSTNYKDISIIGVGFYCEIWDANEFEKYIYSITPELILEAFKEMESKMPNKKTSDNVSQNSICYDMSKPYTLRKNR